MVNGSWHGATHQIRINGSRRRASLRDRRFERTESSVAGPEYAASACPPIPVTPDPALWCPAQVQPGDDGVRVAALRRGGRQDDCIVVFAEPVGRDIKADGDPRPEDDPGGSQPGEIPVEHRGVQRVLRSPVTKATTKSIGALEDGDGVSGPVELLRGGEPGGA